MTVDIHTTYRVYYRVNWTDNWVYDDTSYPETWSNAVSPNYGSASIIRDFGEIKRENWTAFFPVAPGNFMNYYVLIEANYNGNSWYPFCGVVSDQSDMLMNDVAASGVQKIIAREIGYVLDRRPISFSRVFRNGVSRLVQRVYPFNEMPEIGTKLRGNQSKDPGPNDTRIFDDDPTNRKDFPADTVWNASTACDYLLSLYAPSYLGVYLTQQSASLTKIEDTWNVDGMTLWQALSTIINPRYGFGFTPVLDYTANKIKLEVWTTTGTPITISGTTIPANDRPTTFGIPTSFPFNHVLGTLQTRLTNTTAYGAIEVRGNFVKSTATWSHENEALTEGWDAGLEAEYIDPGGADAEEKDQRRSKEKYDAVFCRLVVPRTFAGTLLKYDNTGDPYSAFPLTLANAAPLNDEVGAFAWMGKRFLRELPFKRGYDYTTNPPTNNNADDTQDEYLPMMAWINDTYDGDNHDATDRLVPIDRITESIPDVSLSLSIQPLDKQLGFQLNCTPRHLLAGNSLVPSDESNIYPEFDYQDLLVTATVECDERIVARQTIPGGPPDHLLVIDAPDMECWYVHPHTIVDVDDAGDPEYYVGPELIRNDLPKLNGILAGAMAWHGQIRQAITIPLSRVANWVPLGSFLIGISGQTLSIPVRAPITGQSVDCRSNSMTIETAWGSKDFGPDFSRLAGNRGRR